MFVGIGETKVKDPSAHPTDPRAEVRGWSNGLTKRELFAAMAMQGLISNCDINEVVKTEAAQLVLNSIYLADCLIAELEK